MNAVLPKTSRWVLISFAIIAATLFHIAALYTMHDLRMGSYTTHNALLENQTFLGKERDEMLAKKRESELRNEQLAEIFTEKINKPDESQSLQYEFPSAQEDFLASPLSNISAELPLRHEELSKLPSLPTFDDIQNTDTHKTIMQESTDPKTLTRSETIAEILFPKDGDLADELIMATEMAHSDIQMTAPETVSEGNTFKVGKPEDASLLGTAFQNRSGFLDQGITDTLFGSASRPISLSDLGMPQQNILDLYSLDKREVSLPGSNKNELRGFEYTSLGTIASSDDFILNVEYAPMSNGPGYMFRLELVAKPKVKFKRIRQNVFFLVDRSHSIRYQRYEYTKQAVAKALALLQPGDTFNILVFDDSIKKMAPQSVPWSPRNIEYGKVFLATEKYGGAFATTDLYSSLGKIVPTAVAENEVNTAVLLSDGDTYLSLEKQRTTIGGWTAANAGKMSLYCVASGKGNNLALLDLLSSFNKGSLQYSASDNGIGSILFNLLQSIRNPIGKHITITTVKSTPETVISLFPSNQYLPNLYANIPYTVYGVVNTLNDFHIFFQGRYYDKYLDIKQEVSFANAKRVDGKAIERKLAVQQAYESYDAFLNDGRPAHLTRAKQLLAPYRIPVAFR